MQVLGALRDLFRRDIPADLVFLASTIERLIAEIFPSEGERLAAERVAEEVLGQALSHLRGSLPGAP
jgi:hypothetical protein